MALFESTSAYDTTEYYDNMLDAVQEGNIMMMELMEESYRLDGAIYLTDAMLENKRAEGVAESDLSVLMEEAKSGFKEKVKNFFKMIWQKICAFFKKVKHTFKYIFSKKYRVKAKAVKAAAAAGNAKPTDNSDQADVAKAIADEGTKQSEEIAKKGQDDLNNTDAEKTPSASEANSEATANIDAVKKRKADRAAKKVPTNAKEAEQNAETNIKTIDEIEKMVDKFHDNQQKLLELQVKAADAEIAAANDPAQVQKIKAVHQKIINAIQAITAKYEAAMLDCAKKAAESTSKMNTDGLNALEKSRKEKNERAAKMTGNTPVTASWDPSLETYVIEGDDTPDLDDLDDDFDDTDEACGKKSLKEGATLLDQALGML